MDNILWHDCGAESARNTAEEMVVRWAEQGGGGAGRCGDESYRTQKKSSFQVLPS